MQILSLFRWAVTLGVAGAAVVAAATAQAGHDHSYYGASEGYGGEYLPPARDVVNTPPSHVDNGYWRAFYWNRGKDMPATAYYADRLAHDGAPAPYWNDGGYASEANYGIDGPYPFARLPDYASDWGEGDRRGQRHHARYEPRDEPRQAAPVVRVRPQPVAAMAPPTAMHPAPTQTAVIVPIPVPPYVEQEAARMHSVVRPVPTAVHVNIRTESKPARSEDYHGFHDHDPGLGRPPVGKPLDIRTHGGPALDNTDK